RAAGARAPTEATDARPSSVGCRVRRSGDWSGSVAAHGRAGLARRPSARIERANRGAAAGDGDAAARVLRLSLERDALAVVRAAAAGLIPPRARRARGAGAARLVALGGIQPVRSSRAAR